MMDLNGIPDIDPGISIVGDDQVSRQFQDMADLVVEFDRQQRVASVRWQAGWNWRAEILRGNREPLAAQFSWLHPSAGKEIHDA